MSRSHGRRRRTRDRAATRGRLAAAADPLSGLITTASAQQAGVHRSTLSRWTREGLLVRRGQGRYELAGGVSAGSAVARALVLVGGEAVVSHRSAARLRGWGLLVDPELPEITVDRDRRRARGDVAVVHRGDVHKDTEHVLIGAGGFIRVTTPDRTVFDIARTRPLAEAVVAADSALRSGLVDREQLQSALKVLPNGPGRRRVERVVALCSERSESVLESLGRLCLVLAGLIPSAQQLWVTDGGRRIGRVDLAYEAERVVVEFDGFEFHSDRKAYRKDRERLNAFARAGWVVLRFTWEDVIARPQAVVDTVRATLATRRVV